MGGGKNIGGMMGGPDGVHPPPGGGIGGSPEPEGGGIEKAPFTSTGRWPGGSG